VLTITISKEALDDYQRYKRDKEANSQLYNRLTPSGIQNIPSSKIRVGDLLYIMKDQRVSLLSTSYCFRLIEIVDPCRHDFIKNNRRDGC
jgi:magnesium-transporting ATPase (P-type)